MNLPRRKPAPREVVPFSLATLVAAARHARRPSPGGTDPRDQLRDGVARSTGARHVALTASARHGLYWLFKAVAERRGAGEVLFWNYNFFAVPDMARRAGLTPVFLDGETIHGEPSIDDARRAIGPRTRAICVSHHFGRPSNLAAWSALAQEHDLDIVEDCAHAFGAAFDGTSVGRAGIGGAFSLSLTKALAGGAGGVVISDDDALGAQLAAAEARLTPTDDRETLSTIASAAAGGLLLHPRTFRLGALAATRLADRFGGDPIDSLMTEPAPTQPEPVAHPPAAEVPGRALAPAFAWLATQHLSRVIAEAAHRRRIARALIEAGPWRTLQMPTWEADRVATYLNFVVRVDDVAALRRALWRVGVDTRRDYLTPMVTDSAAFPNTAGLQRRGVYLPVRTLVDDDLPPLIDALRRFDRR